MKKLFLISLLTIILLSAFIFARNVSAASCISSGGACIWAKTTDSTPTCPSDNPTPGTADQTTACQTPALPKSICCLPKTTVPPATAPSTGAPAAGSVGTPSTGSGGSVSLVDVSPVGDLTGAAGIATLIGLVLNAVLGLIGAFALLMFVYGGFLMLASGGKPDAINKGKGVLVWAIIGLIVIIGSYVLSDFIIKGIMSGVTGGDAGTPAGTSSAASACSGTKANGPGTCTPGLTQSNQYSCCDCGNTPETKNMTCQTKSTPPQTGIVELHCGTGTLVCAPQPGAPTTIPTTNKDKNGCISPNNVAGCIQGATSTGAWSCCDCGLTGSDTYGKSCKPGTASSGVPLHCGKSGSLYCL